MVVFGEAGEALGISLKLLRLFCTNAEGKACILLIDIFPIRFSLEFPERRKRVIGEEHR